MNANYLGRGFRSWFRHLFYRVCFHGNLPPDRGLGIIDDRRIMDCIHPNGDLIRFVDGIPTLISPVNQRNIWLLYRDHHPCAN